MAFALVGLGIANHPIAAMHVPALAAMIVLAKPATLGQPMLWLTCAACLLPGMLLYAWVPLRARYAAAVNWGNIRSARDLWNFLRRKQYWQYRYVISLRTGCEVVAFYLRRVVVERRL